MMIKLAPQDLRRRLVGDRPAYEKYDGRPVSVKPITYKTMDTLGETIDALMVYYEKKSNGTTVAEFDEVERR